MWIKSSDDPQDLLFDAIYPASGSITRSLFEDELRRSHKKSSRSETPPDLLDCVRALSPSPRVPLSNEPATFPEFEFAPEPSHVKFRRADLHALNASGVRAATRRMILNRDPAHAYLLKVVTGHEKHTEDGKRGVVRPAVVKVCQEHGYEPFRSPGNEGIYEVEIPGAFSDDDDQGA